MQHPAVVTPLDEHMGLDIAHSLAPRGIPVYGIDADPGAPGRWSRRCRFILGPDPERDGELAYVRFLVEFGERLGVRAVLYPLSDAHVLAISRHRVALQRHYAFVMPPHETVEQLLTKDGLQATAQACGIPAPQSFVVGRPIGIEEVAHRVTYPALLKPTESPYWHTPQITRLLRTGLLDGQAKVIVCATPEALLQAYRQVAAYDDRLVVQEVIPGEDSRLAYLAVYLDRQSMPLGIFSGRKHRVIPIGFGSASYVRSFHDPDLVSAGLKLLSATHYQGLGGVELKLDPRDSCYKLIEVNARFGMWDGLGVRCGVDLPYIAYCDALQQPVDPQLTFREGVIWVDWQRDVRAAFAYWRSGQLSPADWLRSLGGEKMWAVHSRDDWRPGVAYALRLVGRMGQRLRAWTAR